MIRHDWDLTEIKALYELPLLQLLSKSHEIHKQNFPDLKITPCTLLSIKTGNCPEDCGYCAQSGHFKVAIEKNKLLSKEEVHSAIKNAKAAGAERFCLSAAWRSPTDRDLEKVIDFIQLINNEGMESCVTLGMINEAQAKKLAEAGLDFYNHNLDTSEQYYQKVVSTRTYQDRLNTIDIVQKSGIKVCTGGIIGMGESVQDRLELLRNLANLDPHPPSVTCNSLIPFEGTPLAKAEPLPSFEMARFIAIARILMPKSHVRISAGRERMSEEYQVLCFMAGANSIFIGEKLNVAKNCEPDDDHRLLKALDHEFAE